MAGVLSSVFMVFGALFLVTITVQEISGLRTRTQVGGLSEPRRATAEIQRYVDMVKPAVEDDVGRTLDKYEAKIYRTQIVNGINYFIKVDTGDVFVHIRLHKSFQGEITFHSTQDGKSFDDELEYF